MAQIPSQKMKNRLNRVVAFIILIGFLIVAFKLSYVAIGKNKEYSKLADNQHFRGVTINADRGTIYDANMKVLAQSATVWTVIISPSDIIKAGQQDLVATGLSEILEMDKNTILDKTKNEKSQYEIVKKRIEKPQADAIRNFVTDKNAVGVSLIEDSKRYYPYNNLASSVIGFTGDENKGLYGLEAYYDEYLKGLPGYMMAAKNATGSDMPFQYEKMHEPVDGNSLVLTIDEVIQHYLEKALDNVITQHNVKNRAAGVVMDVNTGKVLAMASKPDFNLNEPFTISDPKSKEYLETITDEEQKKKETANLREAQWKNKVITETYEPGSVFKIVPAAASLEEGTSTLESRFNCTGSIQPVAGAQVMKCWKHSGHGTQNFTTAIVNSCNPALVNIGAGLGPQKFYKYFKSFGMTEKSGIDLPGEVNSITLAEKDLGPVQLASSSFGQSNKITPLQMITAASAAVNGGKLYQPYVVDKIINKDGKIIKTNKPNVRRQVISEDTSNKILGVLEAVVANNTESNGKIKGYRISGKSGTSEKLETPQKDDYISSFVGFAPADNPQIAVLVIVDEPTAGHIYGNLVAAPTVAQVLSETLPYLGINPSYSEEDLQKISITVPNYIGQEVANAQSKLIQQGVEVKVVGSGSNVIKQIPAAGNAIHRGGKVILYTEESSQEESVTVPNVIGMTPQQANKTLANVGLNIKFTGNAESQNSTVISQNVAAGTVIARGSIIQVNCVITSGGEGG